MTNNVSVTNEKPDLFNKLEYDAIRDEFNQLRDEVKIRLQKQQEITSFSIAILVGLIALNQFLLKGDLENILNKNVTLLLSVVSIIFSSFSLMVMEHEANIAHIYIYIDKELLKRMNEIIDIDNKTSSKVWYWNKFRANVQHHSGFTNAFNIGMSWSKYAMTIVPNIVVLVLYLKNISISELGCFNIIFLSLPLIIFIWMLITAIYTGNLYRQMKYE